MTRFLVGGGEGTSPDGSYTSPANQRIIRLRLVRSLLHSSSDASRCISVLFAATCGRDVGSEKIQILQRLAAFAFSPQSKQAA